jgi:hypothetical protein
VKTARELEGLKMATNSKWVKLPIGTLEKKKGNRRNRGKTEWRKNVA